MKHWQSVFWSGRASLICAAVILAGAGSALPAATPMDVRLGGQWVLDPAASDNFEDKLTQLIEVARKRMQPRRMLNQTDEKRPAALPEEPPPEAPDRIRARLDDALRPATTLRISLHEAQIEIQADTGPARVFNLNQTVVRMDSSGTADISTRWSGATLVIGSRYTHRAQRTQQFSVDRSGNLMKVNLQVSDPNTGTLQLKSTYRREDRVRSD